jgi:cobalt-zinc-cadmium efflux system outer membrane protein
MSNASWAPALLLAMTVSAPAHAQLLTEEQFVEDALASHPEIAAAEAAVVAADGARRQAGVLDNPSFSWEREDPDIAREDSWRIGWRLPFDGRRHRVAAAHAGVEAAEFERDLTALELRLELRSLFASWFIAEQRRVVLEDNLERAMRLAEWLRARADEGEAAGVEARRLDLEVVSLEQAAVAARAAARAARAESAVWSNNVAGYVRPARPPLVRPPGTAEIGLRPDIMALGSRLAEVESRHSLARRVIQPPEISAGWKEIREGGEASSGPTLGIAWPLPVFDRNQGNRDEAAAEVDRAELELEAATRRATQQASAALASYTELYGAAIDAGLDPSERGVAEAVFAAFEAGEASLTDVLDAWRSTVDARMARLETLALALATERELEAAIGRPILPGEDS